MGGGASTTKVKALDIWQSLDYLGSESCPAMVVRRRLHYGHIVMIDVEGTGRKDAGGAFAPDVTLRFGTVKGECAAMGHNSLEYTIQVDDHQSEVVRRRFLLPICLPELLARGIDISTSKREVAVEVEWQGGKRFAGDLVSRENGAYSVRFHAGKREVMEGIPIEHLHAPDDETCFDTSPVTLSPDPLWLLDRKIQADIDTKWPIKRRMKEVLAILKNQMRPPRAEPLRGPFVGQKAFDSEGYPAHPAPLPQLKIDGAFVDTWGKYAGKIKFATTFKIGPSYPRMDAWVDSVDAGDPLYFHAALPVYGGLICLGMFKNPGETGPGQPEWIRASDVALVGVAVYIDGVLVPGTFTEPPLEKSGFQKYGHDSCHFIPGCVSTYMADSAWIGGVFCLAPSELDYELRDDIYTVAAYHQYLREGPKRPGFGSNEIDVQINLVLSTNYLANIRQVCSGSVRVSLSDQGLAMAYERMKDVQENRLTTQAALNPKRPRKVLSEMTYEEAVEQRLVDYPAMGGNMVAAASASPASGADVVAVAAPLERKPPNPSLEPGRNIRAELERRMSESTALPGMLREAPRPPPPPPLTTGIAALPPETPNAAKGVSVFSAASINKPMGSAAAPIRGPDESLLSAAPASFGRVGRGGKQPTPPRRQASRSPTPPRGGLPPPPPRRPSAAPH